MAGIEKRSICTFALIDSVNEIHCIRLTHSGGAGFHQAATTGLASEYLAAFYAYLCAFSAYRVPERDVPCDTIRKTLSGLYETYSRVSQCLFIESSSVACADA